MIAASRHPIRQWFAIAPLLFSLLLSSLLVSAQDDSIPVTVGENQIGEMSDSDDAVDYSLSVATPQSVSVQVLAITTGFAPTFRVIDPSGIVILDISNTGTQTIVDGSPALFSPGVYIIEVGSVNPTPGQFLLSVQPGEPLALPLAVGENQIGTISDASGSVQYGLSVAGSQSVSLQVLAITAGFAPSFRVFDPDESVIFEVANADGQNIAGGVLNLPAADTYLVEVRSANNTPGDFLISAQPGAPFPTPTSTQQVTPSATATPVSIPIPSDVCAATAYYIPPPIRSGPSTAYGVIGSLNFGVSAPVIGRLADNSWFQVNLSGVIGWVSASVVTPGGNCTGVIVVAPPAPAPTTVSVPTQPPQQLPPTNTPTNPTNPILQVTPITAPLRPANPTSTPNLLLQVTVGTPPRRRLPDLALGAVYVGIPGDVTTLYYFQYLNLGDANVTGPIWVRTCFDLAINCSAEVFGVSGIPARSQAVGYSAVNQLYGVHTVTIVLDPDNQIGESNESNNTVTVTLDFGQPP